MKVYQERLKVNIKANHTSPGRTYSAGAVTKDCHIADIGGMIIVQHNICKEKLV